MPEGLNRKWNAFAGGLIHDLDGDGVEELIVTNGGDTTFLPEVTFLHCIGTYDLVIRSTKTIKHCVIS